MSFNKEQQLASIVSFYALRPFADESKNPGVKILMQNVSCQPDEVNYIFSTRNITQCQRYVRSIYRKLDKAVANDDCTKIRWYVHLLTKVSKSAKVLAVWRITKVNSGRYTAGTDGVKIAKSQSIAKQDQLRHRLLESIDPTSNG